MRAYEVADMDKVTARYASRLEAIAHAVSNNVRVVNVPEDTSATCAERAGGCFGGRVDAEEPEVKALIDSLVERIRQTLDPDFCFP